MKYELELRRVETKTIELFAESPQKAVEMARKSEAGFTVEYLRELGEGDESFREFDVHGICEGCEAIMLDDDVYVDSEGLGFCQKCFDSLAAENLGG